MGDETPPPHDPHIVRTTAGASAATDRRLARERGAPHIARAIHPPRVGSTRPRLTRTGAASQRRDGLHA
eukprot:scaffold15540_cov31-Tisochrysis_lutea.AAC.4